MRGNSFLILILFALVGCESVPVAFDGVKREAKTQIDVYMNGKKPEKPYKVIAAFAERDGPEREASRQNSFIAQAKKLGADGIIINSVDSGGVAYGPFGGGSKAMFRATAIVYE